MLAQLKIRDLVLFDELELELSPGFNALTGETGAGKSLVATAIDLLLGRRAKGTLVRKGASEAEIAGLFDISDEPEVRKRLAEAGFPDDEELLIRRIVPAEGRHRCYVNGKLASLSVLASISRGLANVMSQHEQYDLMDPTRQLDLIDLFGELNAKRDRMTDAYMEHKSQEAAVAELKAKDSERAGRLDFIAYQLNEIDRIDPKPGELEEVTDELERLRHQELLVNTAQSAASQLYESDASAYEQIGRTISSMEHAAQFDSSFQELAGQLGEALAVVEDIARTAAGYASHSDMQEHSIDELEDRREELSGLGRKHGIDLREILTMRERLAEEVSLLSDYESAVQQAESSLNELESKVASCARDLTKARKTVARKLARAVSNELKDLELGAAQFGVDFHSSPNGFGPKGADRVEFVVALNTGEGSHPLRRVASGGELSRIMLALKRALAGVGPSSTYVFDEVDTGIGGSVAAAVGNKLSEVANHHQVICITHLPQISGMADAHFYVAKKESDGRTVAQVRQLAREERVDELARMLGGAKVTAKTKAAAQELLISKNAGAEV